MTNFTTDQIGWFDLSRDGRPTLFSRGAMTKDVVLISGFGNEVQDLMKRCSECGRDRDDDTFEKSIYKVRQSVIK